MPVNKGRILYVEDHADTRELVKLIMLRQNYEVVTAASLQEGLQVAASEPFDLYLLDTWLPDGSGIELCRKLREKDSHTPVLFYSAAAYELDRTAALQAGAQGYITKPSPNGELFELIEKLIKASRIAKSKTA